MERKKIQMNDEQQFDACKEEEKTAEAASEDSCTTMTSTKRDGTMIGAAHMTEFLNMARGTRRRLPHMLEPSLPVLAIEDYKEIANAVIDDPTTRMAPLHGELRQEEGAQTVHMCTLHQ